MLDSHISNHAESGTKICTTLFLNKVLNFVQHLMFVVQNVLQSERIFLNSVLNVFVNQVQQAYVTASTIPILVILL